MRGRRGRVLRAAALLPTHSLPFSTLLRALGAQPEWPPPGALMLCGSQLGSASGAVATDQGGRGEARSSFLWLPPCRGSPQGGWVPTPKAIAPLTDSCVGFRPREWASPSHCDLSFGWKQLHRFSPR